MPGRASSTSTRSLARLAGVVGPAAFVTGWVGSGWATSGYSPVDDAISVLARRGAPTRVPMTAAFVVFAVSIAWFGWRWLRGRAGVACVATGLATLGVAAVPLRAGQDVPGHAVAAVAAYVANLAVLVLAAREDILPRWSAALATVAALALAGTALGPAHGLFQRVGLTTLDVWFVVVAWRGGPAGPTRRGAPGGAGGDTRGAARPPSVGASPRPS